MFKQLRAMMTASTSNSYGYCPVHPQKPLQLFQEQLVCFICEADKQTAALTKEMHMQHAEQLAKKHYSMLRRASILQDETLLHATFDSYTQNVAPHTEEYVNKQEALKALHAYRNPNEESFNTWFTGDTGVGKSHLAMALLHALNETDGQQRSCLFVDLDEALRRVRTSYRSDSPFTESYVIDMMSRVDFLAIDDIGAETGNVHTDKTASDFVNRVLRAVLNARQHKSTIFTTNLTRAQLEHVYDKKLVSRAMRNVFLIKFEQASDKRIRRKVL